MHGDGTKLVNIQNNPPPARLLDITRLVRRAGRVLTGVDRVEAAYLEAFLADSIPVFGLVRTTFGYLILDESGLRQVQSWLRGARAPVKPDFLSRLERDLSEAQRQAQTLVRGLAIGRAMPRKFCNLLAKTLPRNISYVNVGHSNITARVFEGVKQALNARISVMVHDIIPLEFPQYQRVGTVETFREKVLRIQKYADVILYNSADTQKRTEACLGRFGAVPFGVVAHLGVNKPALDPDFKVPPSPYFVMIGTIEPRKNHAFILDIWEKLGAMAPHLYICGGRGWNNEEVFRRLDLCIDHPAIHECNHLKDTELAALLGGSNGLLFPSLCEGFGLPPVEAAALGVPVLCNNLDVLHEVLGKIPVYLDVSEEYLWIEKIKELTLADPENRNLIPHIPPDWSEHFKIVLSII